MSFILKTPQKDRQTKKPRPLQFKTIRADEAQSTARPQRLQHQPWPDFCAFPAAIQRFQRYSPCKTDPSKVKQIHSSEPSQSGDQRHKKPPNLCSNLFRALCVLCASALNAEAVKDISQDKPT